MEDKDLKEILGHNRESVSQEVCFKEQKQWYTKQPESACATYNLHKPIRFNEFKMMPDDIKKMYIKSLQERFSVHDTDIAKMMHCDNSTFSKLRRMLQIPRVRQRVMTKEQVADWESFIAQDKDFAPQENTGVSEANIPSEGAITENNAASIYETPVTKQAEDLALSNVALEFCGYMDADAIAKKIAVLFPSSCKCRVNISIEVEGEIK